MKSTLVDNFNEITKPVALGLLTISVIDAQDYVNIIQTNYVMTHEPPNTNKKAPPPQIKMSVALNT